MIHEHNPPESTEDVENFLFDTTTVVTSGRNALLRSQFTVYPASGGLKVGRPMAVM